MGRFTPNLGCRSKIHGAWVGANYVWKKFATCAFRNCVSVDDAVHSAMVDASSQSGCKSSALVACTERADWRRGVSGYGRAHEAGHSDRERIIAVASGMQLMAEIVEELRSVRDYLLSSVRRVASKAERER